MVPEIDVENRVYHQLSHNATVSAGVNCEIFDSLKKDAQRLNNFRHFQPNQ